MAPPSAPYNTAQLYAIVALDVRRRLSGVPSSKYACRYQVIPVVRFEPLAQLPALGFAVLGDSAVSPCRPASAANRRSTSQSRSRATYSCRGRPDPRDSCRRSSHRRRSAASHALRSASHTTPRQPHAGIGSRSISSEPAGRNKNRRWTDRLAFEEWRRLADVAGARHAASFTPHWQGRSEFH